MNAVKKLLLLSLCLSLPALAEEAKAAVLADEAKSAVQIAATNGAVTVELKEDLTEAQLKEAKRLEDIKEHRWDRLYLTMPYSEATNVCAECFALKAPESPFKTAAYAFMSYDTFSGSTNKNLLTARMLYFDKEDKLLAIEHVFQACTVDQKNYIMNQYAAKYNMTPVQSKTFSWYKVTDGLSLTVELVESMNVRNPYGWQTPYEYSVRSVFYLEKEFMEFVKRYGMVLLPPEISRQ